MPNPFEKIKVPDKSSLQRIVPYGGGGSNNSIIPQNVTYTITNDSSDRTFDADTATLTDVSDVLATLIRDLAAAGIIRVA